VTAVVQTPEVVTFVSLDSPPSERFLAVLYQNGERLPIVFAGKTEEGVSAAAAQWWQAEQAKEVRKLEIAAERAERMRAARKRNAA